ncbi:hypothetical protein CR513_02015, partial [Mucuna pruriens]
MKLEHIKAECSKLKKRWNHKKKKNADKIAFEVDSKLKTPIVKLVRTLYLLNISQFCDSEFTMSFDKDLYIVKRSDNTTFFVAKTNNNLYKIILRI